MSAEKPLITSLTPGIPYVEAPVPKFIADWFTDKTPEQIVSRAAPTGRILWPDTLKVRTEGGGVKEIPVYLQTANPIEKMQAVAAVNAKVAEIHKVDKSKLPLSRADAIELAGVTEWDELHSAYLVSFCILEHDPIEGRADGARRLAYMPHNIIGAVGMTTLYDVYNRLSLYAALEDVRIAEITPEIFDGFVRSIARCMSLAPLFDCTGSVFDKLVVMMAEEIVRLRALGETSSPSSSTTTVE